MEITPATRGARTAKVRSAKSAVSKSSSATVKPKPSVVEPAAAPAPRKRKTLTKKVAEKSPAAATAVAPDLGPMIATAAYFLAEQRQFAPGYDMQDWLAAEQLIRSSPIGK